MAQWNKPTITVVDAPGAPTVSSPAWAPFCGTTVQANNDLGDIGGYYTDANIVPHGFLRHADGKFISFGAPGAGLGAGLDQGTVAYSINDLGVTDRDRRRLFRGILPGPSGQSTAKTRVTYILCSRP
jgi:hypothetical protein